MDRADLIPLKDGKTLEIYFDYHAESPREWDNLTKMYCFHRNYNLGDEHNIDYNDYDNFNDMITDNFSEDDIVVPLYMYEHGNIALSTSPFHCRFDSGQLGFVVVTKDDIIKEYGSDSKENRETALRVLEGEVETYHNFVSGQVYGYILKDTDGEEIDSCWGFYGYDLAKNGIYDNTGISQEDVA